MPKPPAAQRSRTRTRPIISNDDSHADLHNRNTGLAAEIISGGGLETALEAEADLGDAAPEVEIRLCEVPSSMHGWRIDKTLAALVPEFSRSYLQQLMADGAVQFRGGDVRKPSARVSAGDSLRVELRPTQQAMAFVAQPMALDVVFEDDDLLVINKPAGLVVHPAAGHWSGTLLNGLLAHHAGAAALPRAGIVHRLDKDTSGLMLVGKTLPAVTALVRDIGARDVQRRYLALAWGDVPEAVRIEEPIGRDPRSRLRMAVVPAGRGGREARTDVGCVAQRDGVSALFCKLHTGRTHQIRVHLSCKGWPLVADTLYGGRPA
ncbi:MAG: RluA family pseudouridine synthase, partial [Hydrogenophaga sp.]|nr:RluA family pseudouridine synthase [Hydrogenophaga sp.]